MKTTVQSVQAVLDQRTGQQRQWTSPEGKTSYYFHYVLANGQQGEVGHQQPQPRFPAGTEVEATDVTKDPKYPKLKLEKPGGGFQRGGGNNDPAYTARVQAAGLVQAAISAGAKSVQDMVAIAQMGVQATEQIKQQLLAASAPAPAPPQPAPQPYPQPVAQPPMTHQPQAQYVAPAQPPYQAPAQGGYAQPSPNNPPWANNPGAPFNPQQAIAGHPQPQPQVTDDLPF